MNMHANPSFEQSLKDSYADVKRRLYRPARAVKDTPIELAPFEPCVYGYRCQKPKDAHIQAWNLWRVEMASPCKSYIRRRCKELGVSYQQIMGACTDTKVFKARDMIIFEIKTHVQPGISYLKLARLFSKDHSSMISAYNRYLAQQGDAEAAVRVQRRLEEARRGHRARKARAAGI